MAYNIAMAKAHFSTLVDKALAGEEVVIARDNKPLLKLVPYHDPSIKLKPGALKGQIWIADDFDAPIDDFRDYM
ncbi:MAG TPA: type II toxin-antitoxin system prevent-host-death family antitoxin [Vicinamibacterales bacterium]|nr:type II toxin-antitoxin system prevent-host-death family antitoxin [Vicinamibacterales bacterium]